MLARLHWLAVLRQVAIPLTGIETLAVLLEKTTGRDPLPDWMDVSIGIAGLGALLVLVVAETLTRTLNVVLTADVADLATRRRLDEEDRRTQQRRRERIENVLEGSLPSVAFQRIADLHTGRTVGFEAVPQFGTGTPEPWFAEAAEAGLGVELEVKAMRRALQHLGDLPEGTYLAVNCSPAALVSEQVSELLLRYDTARIVVQLSEQTPVEDYARSRAAIDALRRVGVRIAVDDLGAGYSSLRHVIAFQPEIIKLGRVLTEAAEEPAQLMIQTIVGLGRLTGAAIVAKGLRDARTLDLVRDLGVDAGQGPYFGEPQPLDELTAAADAAGTP
jgi:EAL domain-containing protein (putative c-di-GMP-specific phosphodiesterase class I)